MLSEIYCEKFQQKTILFHEGLNVVLGTDKGDNSIGKSTLLLIIDFVFGGTTYAKNKDISDNVGPHEIMFKFVFNKQSYYFSRKSDDIKEVWKCNSKYKKIEPISLQDYTNWLDLQYRVKLSDLSFRECVSRFMRIYGKDNYNEHLPLKSFNNNSMRDAILSFIKIFDKYDAIKDAETFCKQTKDEYDAFKNAQKYSFIPEIKSNQYKTNCNLIDKFKSEIETLSKDLENNLLDIDSETTEETIKLKNELSNLKKQRYVLINKIRNLNLNVDYPFSKTTKDFEILKTFFPTLDIKRVEEIESFHNKISEVFKKQSEGEKGIFETQLVDINHSITEVENKLSDFTQSNKLSKVVLEKHSSLMSEIEKMSKENDAFLKRTTLKTKKDKAVTDLKELKKDQLIKIENDLNCEMKKINSKIYGPDMFSPTIKFNGDSYLFHTPNDTGTGTAYKGLIVFDLATIRLTKLPVLIHDSLLLKQISDEVLTNILVEYENCNKQIFIAFDKQESYGNKALSILENHKVIKLAHNGYELFGRFWGKKKTTDLN